jgi:hypothetical protein
MNSYSYGNIVGPSRGVADIILQGDPSMQYDANLPSKKQIADKMEVKAKSE